ncbi:MAG: hypothetical protein ACRYFX_04435 [Janthinobacterium lividum]
MATFPASFFWLCPSTPAVGLAGALSGVLPTKASYLMLSGRMRGCLSCCCQG